ncbi:NUDIX hydrolase [Roseomonas sp. OT10]|uniref:NUDIX domain-containing protein n=1 Tax=Roseomonas cutis TaxID=2897332 RepID=UPI001E546CAE|nr:NUDIX hydrolase [Roseomonas sp. OT10]UFN47502.1 NUDIX hydrolase [Roseomonas sp. OT10]
MKARPPAPGDAGTPPADAGSAPPALPRPGPAHPDARPLPTHPLYHPEEEATVHAGRFALQQVRFRYTRRDGALSGELTWELWRRGRGGVLILPWDPWHDRVALIRQFRLAALAAGGEPIQTEFPAGLLDGDEPREEAARRELAEETGLSADRLVPMGRWLLMPGGCDEVLHYHLARVRLETLGEGASAGLDSEHEETQVVVVPLEEALAMVADGRIFGAPAALGLLWLQAHRERLRPEWQAGEWQA